MHSARPNYASPLALLIDRITFYGMLALLISFSVTIYSAGKIGAEDDAPADSIEDVGY